MNGVSMGAKKPPTCALVFKMSDAPPICSPAISVTPAQNGPSQHAAKPNASARHTAAVTPALAVAM